MVHNIATIAGREAFFAGEGKSAWHGIGTVVEGLATAEEALELANLKWGVNLLPVKFDIPAGGLNTYPDRFVTVRDTDNFPLGIVGGDYIVTNNSAVFAFLDDITDSGEAKYSTAGALGNGARVFMTAKVGEGFKVADSDELETYLVITTSHDGKQALTAFTTTIRVVCQNTLTLALAGAKNKWTITHRHDLSGRVQEAREALNLTLEYQDAFQEEVERLLAVEVTKDQFEGIVKSILPDQKRKFDRSLVELMDVFENEPTVNAGGGEGTGWAALNSWTFWTDWRKEFRTAEARYKALTEGPVASSRNIVRNKILALA